MPTSHDNKKFLSAMSRKLEISFDIEGLCFEQEPSYPHWSSYRRIREKLKMRWKRDNGEEIKKTR
jgi:hypothetical protein